MARKGQKLSEETKMRIGIALRGRKLTEETKKKMSMAQKGKRISEEQKQKLRMVRLGRPNPQHAEFMTGRKHSVETRQKMSLANKGEKSPWWRGGKTPLEHTIRASLDYRLWRTAVFERDDYTCVFCGIRGAKLQADHIKPFAYFLELRFDVDNGRTLCVPCHKKTETFGARRKDISDKEKE